MDSINDLLAGSGFDREIGLLNIDIDGNDYWIWKAIDVSSPIIVVLEYNSIFGSDRAITVPYDRAFDRARKHYSNLYFGASLRALYQISHLKGYAFVGSNSAGNNAYFVGRDKLNATVKESSLEKGYVRSRFRQSRDKLGNLKFLTWHEQVAAIKGLAVYNTETDRTETLTSRRVHVFGVVVLSAIQLRAGRFCNTRLSLVANVMKSQEMHLCRSRQCQVGHHRELNRLPKGLRWD
jgi:hypothetical protein